MLSCNIGNYLTKLKSERYIKMVNNIEFRNVDNHFQKKKLKNDINEINTCNKILVSADKSRNLYKLEKDQYQKLLKKTSRVKPKKSQLTKRLRR